MKKERKKERKEEILGLHVKTEERIGLHMTCIYTDKKKMFMKSEAECR